MSELQTDWTAGSMEELLTYSGHQFINSAYHTLLKRDPSPEVLNYFAEQLLGGTPKIEIVRRIVLLSANGSHPVHLPGLGKALRRHRKKSLPLIGWLFKLWYYGLQSRQLIEKSRDRQEKTLRKPTADLNPSGVGAHNESEQAWLTIEDLVKISREL